MNTLTEVSASFVWAVRSDGAGAGRERVVLVATQSGNGRWPDSPWTAHWLTA